MRIISTSFLTKFWITRNFSAPKLSSGSQPVKYMHQSALHKKFGVTAPGGFGGFPPQFGQSCINAPPVFFPADRERIRSSRRTDSSSASPPAGGAIEVG